MYIPLMQFKIQDSNVLRRKLPLTHSQQSGRKAKNTLSQIHPSSSVEKPDKLVYSFEQEAAHIVRSIVTASSQEISELQDPINEELCTAYTD